MQKPTLLWVLLVALVPLAACSSDPMPETKTYYLGNSAAIEYPEDWYVSEENGRGVLFSPQPGSIEDLTPRPLFIVARGSWSEHDDTDQLERIRVDGKTAYRFSFDPSDSMGNGLSEMQGWFVLVDVADEAVQIIAASPPIAWKDHENVFEAMLSRMRLAEAPSPAPLPILEPTNTASPPLGSEGNPIIWSLVPSGDLQRAGSGAQALADLLHKETGLYFVTNYENGFAGVVEAMCAGRAKIGWLNTFNYVLAHEKHGVDVALVTIRFGSTSYKGQINVRADSGISSVQDLKGKVMCWVDPISSSGYIVPRIMLKANGIDPDKDLARAVQAGSHSNVTTQVYNGDCDAGATYADARDSVEDQYADVKEKVLVLGYTAEIPNDSISFAKDFPADLRDKIVDALLRIAVTYEGGKALDDLFSITGLERADESIFDAFCTELRKADVKIEDLVR